jgi:hypothetical protein
MSRPFPPRRRRTSNFDESNISNTGEAHAAPSKPQQQETPKFAVC